jgi:hypothetical protein
MARVIQDSDDELDEEDLEKNEDQLRAPAAEDALSKQLDPTPQSGTGSTGTFPRVLAGVCQLLNLHRLIEEEN